MFYLKLWHHTLTGIYFIDFVVTMTAAAIGMAKLTLVAPVDTQVTTFTQAAASIITGLDPSQVATATQAAIATQAAASIIGLDPPQVAATATSTQVTTVGQVLVPCIDPKVIAGIEVVASPLVAIVGTQVIAFASMVASEVASFIKELCQSSPPLRLGYFCLKIRQLSRFTIRQVAN